MFEINTMGNYHDLYLKTDVFEKFIVTCSEFYGSDLCHNFFSPKLDLKWLR